MLRNRSNSYPTQDIKQDRNTNTKGSIKYRKNPKISDKKKQIAVIILKLEQCGSIAGMANSVLFAQACLSENLGSRYNKT